MLNGVGNPGAAINPVRKKASSLSPLPAPNFPQVPDRYRTTVDVGTPLNDEGTVRVRIAAAGERGRSFMERHQERKGTVYGTLEADLSSNTLLRLGADYQQNRPKAFHRAARCRQAGSATAVKLTGIGTITAPLTGRAGIPP